jgi:dihydroorotase-like cyclic amidohydrolase
LESIKNVGPQCEQIDAEGKCLLPAGIDVTKLLAESDSIGQGTKAALKGGTGTVRIFDIWE